MTKTTKELPKCSLCGSAHRKCMVYGHQKVACSNPSCIADIPVVLSKWFATHGKLQLLQARCDELERERDGLNEFLKFVIGNSFEGCDTDGCSAQDKAVELGLLREENYDKKVHGDGPQNFYELNEGDTILVYTNPQEYPAEHDAEVAREAIIWAKNSFVLASTGNEDYQNGVGYCLDEFDKHLEKCSVEYNQRNHIVKDV